jgi:hypothetical protein
MKRRTIETIGTINVNEVSFDFAGQIEIHMPLEEVGSEANLIINNCKNQYKKQYPSVDIERDVYYDFRLVFTSSLANSEYSEFGALVYIWQKSDEETGQNTCEVHEGYKLQLTDTDKKKVKRIISDKMYEMLISL